MMNVCMQLYNNVPLCACVIYMYLCIHVSTCVYIHTQLCREMYVLQVNVRDIWVLNDKVHYL